jgi:hypothetical protein
MRAMTTIMIMMIIDGDHNDYADGEQGEGSGEAVLAMPAMEHPAQPVEVRRR